MGKREIRPLATSKLLNRSSQKVAHVITSWLSTDMQNLVTIPQGFLFPVYLSMSAKRRLNLTSLTTLFKDSDVPTKIGRTFTGTRGQFWPDAFLATTNDSCGTSGSQTQVFCYVQLTQTNCWYHGPARPALDCVPSVLLVRLPGMTCRLICATWTYL